MRSIPAIVFLCLFSAIALSEDLVLINGTVIDGTGKTRVIANIRIHEDNVAEIGSFKPLPGEKTLDVKGLIVAPGFIDLQTMSTADVEKDPSAAAMISQGVTTAVLGSDGTGPYSVEDFMRPFDEKPSALNIAVLAGHARIRRQILGDDYKRSPTADELRRMSELVSDAMKQGAFGFASDLQREPASFSSPEELLELARVVARLGGTVLLHARNAKEAIAIARDAKATVQLWNPDKAALPEIDKARAQRIDISADTYSYAQLAKDKTTPLERVVQRLTSTPASRFSLRERGVLKKGVPADIVVFDPKSPASGMKYVFVNGSMALKDGQLTSSRAGQALR